MHRTTRHPSGVRGAARHPNGPAGRRAKFRCARRRALVKRAADAPDAIVRAQLSRSRHRESRPRAARHSRRRRRRRRRRPARSRPLRPAAAASAGEKLFNDFRPKTRRILIIHDLTIPLLRRRQRGFINK